MNLAILKISTISLLAMFGVVGWHCFCGSEVERWAIPLLFTWSVPWFFFVSGVFLVKTVEHKSIVSFYVAKIKSLVIPYLIWCFIGFLITGVNQCGTIWNVFALTATQILPTGNWALWYLRALIVFVTIASPLLYLKRKKYLSRGGVIVIFLSAIFLINRYMFSVSTGSAPFYFAAGLAMSSLILSDFQTSKRMTLALCAIGMVVYVVFKSVHFILGYDLSRAGGNLWANISYIGLMVFLWNALDGVADKLSRVAWLSEITPLTAFVYFMHYPILRKIIENCSWPSNVKFIAATILMPCVFLAFAMLMRKKLPQCYRVLSGGR